jgi:hypothetical protein
MENFGAKQFIGSLVGLSMARELGPVMVAILLAGSRRLRHRRRARLDEGLPGSRRAGHHEHSAGTDARAAAPRGDPWS